MNQHRSWCACDTRVKEEYMNKLRLHSKLMDTHSKMWFKDREDHEGGGVD